jgi:hypothetical protein
LLAMGSSCTSNSDCASGRCSANTCASTYVASSDYCTLP